MTDEIKQVDPVEKLSNEARERYGPMKDSLALATRASFGGNYKTVSAEFSRISQTMVSQSGYEAGCALAAGVQQEMEGPHDTTFTERIMVEQSVQHDLLEASRAISQVRVNYLATGAGYETVTPSIRTREVHPPDVQEVYFRTQSNVANCVTYAQRGDFSRLEEEFGRMARTMERPETDDTARTVRADLNRMLVQIREKSAQGEPLAQDKRAMESLDLQIAFISAALSVSGASLEGKKTS